MGLHPGWRDLVNRLHIDLSHLTVADLSLNKYISQWGHGYESECLPRRDEDFRDRRISLCLDENE